MDLNQTISNLSDFSGGLFSEIFISDAKKNYVLIGLYIPLFLLALSANTLVIIVVFKYHYMRSVTNYFLVNLSVADLLVTLVCMPRAIWSAISMLWFLGDIACMLYGYLQCVAVGASVFTITAMAIDRYLAITQPIGFPRWFNKTSTTVVILVLWLISFIIFSPMLWISKTNVILNETDPPLQLSICVEDWGVFTEYKMYLGIFWFAIIYVIPGLLMVVAYSLMGRRLCSVKPPFDTHEGSASTQQGFRLVRERKRVAWILLLLALLFAACWLPHSIVNLLLDTGKYNGANWLLPYCIFLGHANSAINPIIYCFMTRNFRRSVKELLFRTRNNFKERRTLRGQGTFKSSIERIEFFNYNEIETIDVKLFWFNRTVKASNFTISVNQGCCTNAEKVVVNTYEFLNNQYKPFAVRLEKDRCEFLKSEYKLFVYSDLMKYNGSNFLPTSCPIKKGVYSSFFFVPTSTKLSALPLKKSKVEVITMYGNKPAWKVWYFMAFEHDSYSAN